MPAMSKNTASGQTVSEHSEMDRYSVFRLRDQDGLFLLLQHPGLEASSTVVIAPLVPEGALPKIPVLTPSIEFNGNAYLLLTYRLAAIQLNYLGPFLGTLEGYDYAIQRALARLFFGN